ncbi:hypothetical protein AB4K20DRAFT_1924880 [Rhizopus microsporus]
MIPIIAFGNGTVSKNHAKFKEHRVGQIDALYSKFKKKQQSGEAINALIDSYRTPKG